MKSNGPVQLLAVLLPVVAVCTAGPALAAGIIRNGDFEQGPGMYPGLGKHWEPIDGQSHPTRHSLTPSTRQGGGFCQRLKASPEWEAGAAQQLSDYGSIVAGKSYRIRAWIKTANVVDPAGWCVLSIWWLQGDTCLGVSRMPRQDAGNYDWRLVTWTSLAPPGADRVAIVLTRQTDGDVWYDDISITDAPDSTPIPEPPGLVPPVYSTMADSAVLSAKDRRFHLP